MSAALPYRILTERLLVRCWEPDDALALKQMIDTSLEHLRAWMPWANQEPESLEKKRERIMRFRAEFSERVSLPYGVFIRSNERCVGSISINWRLSADVADLGYWLRAGETGNGYATEAVVGCLTASFYQLGLAVAEVSCNPLNERSGAVPRRLGFSQNSDAVRKTADAKDRMSQVWRIDRATFAGLHPEQAKIMFLDSEGKILRRT